MNDKPRTNDAMARTTHADALTSYVGREADIEAVRAMVDGGRLVSVTGPGGIGKTRLARTVAAALAPGYDGDVLIVELAALRRDADVAEAVAKAIGLRIDGRDSALHRVLDALERRATLLVLDNCEHLPTGCAEFVAAALARCRGITVLVTSRQSLRVAGEQTYRVPPLALPGTDVDDPARIARYPAVVLLADRGRAVRSDFAVTAANATDVAQLCRLLDGLPLAIELAAARLRSLTPQQLVARWRGGLALPCAWEYGVPDRHRTVRAVVDWSYGLCTAQEQLTWARLSVFQDWFELEAAEYVCGGAGFDTPVEIVIDSLVDKSILDRRGDDIAYFRLQPPVREFGRERLAAAGATERTARRHHEWFAELVLLADREFMTPRQDELLRRLRAAHLDLRRAVDWALETPGAADAVIDMVICVDEFWTMAGENHEVRSWLRRALAAAPESGDAYRAWSVAAMHSLWLSDTERAAEELRMAEATAPPGDRLAAARIQMVHATAAKIELDNARAAALAEEAAKVLDEYDDRRAALAARNILALATAAEHTARCLADLRAAIARCTSEGEIFYRCTMLFSLSLIEVMTGDAAAAESSARAALAFTRRWESRHGDAYHVETMAWVATAQQRYQRAATLFGIAAAAWDTLGSDPAHVLVRPHTLFRDAAIAALGRDAFAAAHLAGRTMPVAEAMAFALAEQHPDTPEPARFAPLTTREFEVASLIADGLTNKAIAARLVIAPRTADTHVRNILTKLDFSNRTQLAAWVLSRSA